jgi:hypothetical protein
VAIAKLAPGATCKISDSLGLNPELIGDGYVRRALHKESEHLFLTGNECSVWKNQLTHQLGIDLATP